MSIILLQLFYSIIDTWIVVLAMPTTTDIGRYAHSFFRIYYSINLIVQGQTLLGTASGSTNPLAWYSFNISFAHIVVINTGESTLVPTFYLLIANGILFPFSLAFSFFILQRFIVRTKPRSQTNGTGSRMICPHTALPIPPTGSLLSVTVKFTWEPQVYRKAY